MYKGLLYTEYQITYQSMSYQVDIPNQTHVEPDSESEILNNYLIALMIVISCCSAGGIFEIMKLAWKKCSPALHDTPLRIRKVTSEDELQLHNECSICLDPYVKKQNIILLPCNHVFHSKCIKEWIAKNEECPTCPNCRETIL